MDYDHSLKTRGLPLGGKRVFFDSFIKPYISKPITAPETIDYFYTEAFNAWGIGIQKTDMQKMKTLLSLLKELSKKKESELIAIIEKMHETQDVVRDHAGSDDRNAFNAIQSTNVERIFHDLLDQYKGLFESQFRHWATLPYAYINLVHGKGAQVDNPEDLICVSSSVKCKTLSETKILHKSSSLNIFTDGFENELRNAGGGHDNFELTDNDTVILKIHDPNTGKPKGSKKIELSREELKRCINNCRKSIWCMKVGFAIFLENNTSFALKCHPSKKSRNRYVQNALEEFSKNLSFAITNMEFSDKENLISMTIKYDPKLPASNNQLLIPNVGTYDLVPNKTPVSYQEQMLGILQYLVGNFFDIDTIPNIQIEVLNENEKSLSKMLFSGNQLSKLCKGKEAGLPDPEEGEFPKGKCILHWTEPMILQNTK